MEDKEFITLAVQLIPIFLVAYVVPAKQTESLNGFERIMRSLFLFSGAAGELTLVTILAFGPETMTFGRIVAAVTLLFVTFAAFTTPVTVLSAQWLAARREKREIRDKEVSQSQNQPGACTDTENEKIVGRFRTIRLFGVVRYSSYCQTKATEEQSKTAGQS